MYNFGFYISTEIETPFKMASFLPNEWIKMIFVLFDSKGNATMTTTTIMNEQNNISSVFATRSAGLLNFLLKLNIKAMAT